MVINTRMSPVTGFFLRLFLFLSWPFPHEVCFCVGSRSLFSEPLTVLLSLAAWGLYTTVRLPSLIGYSPYEPLPQGYVPGSFFFFPTSPSFSVLTSPIPNRHPHLGIPYPIFPCAPDWFLIGSRPLPTPFLEPDQCLFVFFFTSTFCSGGSPAYPFFFFSPCFVGPRSVDPGSCPSFPVLHLRPPSPLGFSTSPPFPFTFSLSLFQLCYAFGFFEGTNQH